MNKKAVFVVEDSPWQREDLVGLIQALYKDVSVTEFVDGLPALAAIESLNEDCPGVILTDYDMLEMNGYELACAVKKLFPQNGPRIILITGHYRSDLPADIDSVFDHVLGKPLDIIKLKKALGSI